MEWKLVSRAGVRSLERFLASREPQAVAVSEKVRHGALDRRLREGGRCFYLPDDAAVYQGPGGLFSPVGLTDVAPEHRRHRLLDELRGALGPFFRLHSIMGTRSDVETLHRALRRKPIHTIDYDLLELSWERFPTPGPPPATGLQIVRPTAEDWRRLMPLQTAYEIEEVVLPGRQPNPATSRAALAHSLRTQRVLLAIYQGGIVARVATNARGYQSEQIGGVYTDPRWRRRGVSRWLMGHLLADLRGDQRSASLFVKLDNPAAQKLYRSLGFEFVSPFRISYYQ